MLEQGHTNIDAEAIIEGQEQYRSGIVGNEDLSAHNWAQFNAIKWR